MRGCLTFSNVIQLTCTQLHWVHFESLLHTLLKQLEDVFLPFKNTAYMPDNRNQVNSPLYVDRNQVRVKEEGPTPGKLRGHWATPPGSYSPKPWQPHNTSTMRMILRLCFFVRILAQCCIKPLLLWWLVVNWPVFTRLWLPGVVWIHELPGTNLILSDTSICISANIVFIF